MTEMRTWLVPVSWVGEYTQPRTTPGGTRGRNLTVMCLTNDNTGEWGRYLASNNAKEGIYLARDDYECSDKLDLTYIIKYTSDCY